MEYKENCNTHHVFYGNLCGQANYDAFMLLLDNPPLTHQFLTLYVLEVAIPGRIRCWTKVTTEWVSNSPSLEETTVLFAKSAQVASIVNDRYIQQTV